MSSAETAGTVMVPGFRHIPGHHCGSTALRNLLSHHGAEISEELAFGLGAGACFFYISHDDLSPSRFTNGRTGRLEEQFLELTGCGLELQTAEDPEASWVMARGLIDAGRPALLLTDLFHLDHYGNSAHFPGHAVVLAGYDDETAYVSDTGFEELQRTSLDGLAKARHEQHPFYPLAGHLVSLPEGAEIGDLKDAVPAAIDAAARRMLEPQMEGVEGLPALARFAEELPGWPEAAADWKWCARFNYQAIERRGTGGGNFRPMYGRFLAEAGRPDEAAFAAEAGELWTQLAADLFAASELDEPEPSAWHAIATTARKVLVAETRLWEALVA